MGFRQDVTKQCQKCGGVLIVVEHRLTQNTARCKDCGAEYVISLFKDNWKCEGKNKPENRK